ncbi:radical SAM/SPASM domain-containing protein [Listeria costaricensis]|uniref:radical SAM/SPASM domain-containing protein n=1 Tax=Listeria costaricensis TaxID=2026604 RepID=UPI000C08C191|nr:SPASM domain-containing protein [Listeria costaricensis]
MKRLSVLIKPASSLCNIRCKYCFYADVSSMREVSSFGRMDQMTARKLIDQVSEDLEAGDEMIFAFQGGEPTLAGISFFRFFVQYVQEKLLQVRVQYTIQTNGLLLDKEWCRFFKENQFLVGLSIDGGAHFHNLNRVNTKGMGTYEQVARAKRLLERQKVDFNILCVLTKQVAKNPQRVFKFLLEEKIEFIQFIPCLAELDSDQPSDYALLPEQFASFYKQFFSLWKKELQRGHFISVNLFDNLFQQMLTGRPSACGMNGQCQPHFVIEANGNVYPCDFFVLDEYCLGNILEEKISDMFSKTELRCFIQAEELPDYCQKCEFVNFCHGGCKRMRYSMYLNKDHSYCGYRDFLQVKGSEIYSEALKLAGEYY